VKFLDALALGRVDIVAHSFGGRVAIKLSTELPDRVSKLVLVDSAGIRPPRGLQYYSRVGLAKLGRFVAWIGGPIGRGLRNRIYSRVASADYMSAGALRETFVRVVNEDLTSLLPRIHAPTLLIWGEHDTATPLSAGRKMRDLIPNADMKVLKDAGHFSYLDQYGVFRLLVASFLAGH
jgi:pimeloyl-ACP methyl ester carboxylesterase